MDAYGNDTDRDTHMAEFGDMLHADPFPEGRVAFLATLEEDMPDWRERLAEHDYYAGE